MEFLPVCCCALSSISRSRTSNREYKRIKENGLTGTESDPQKSKCDYIGPPDSLSNLRPIKFYIAPDETPLERQYRESRVEMQEWNQQFWADNNTKYKKMKAEFIQVRLREKYGKDTRERKTLSAGEMSEFYKRFLDDHKDVHKQYNREWYKKNFINLLLAARVWLKQKLNGR